MTLPPLRAERARELLANSDGTPVLVVGDVMIDRFIVGRVTRISPEAPVPVVRFVHEHSRLGGAANVASNLVALGGRVALVAVVGRDEAGRRLREQLDGAGIPSDGLVEDPDRPTIEKVRVVTERNQQVGRIDYESDADIQGTVEAALSAHIQRLGSTARVLLVSDYLKGTITPTSITAVLRLKHARRPLLVDPKIPHLAYYAGATLVTPNHHEAETATHLRIRNDEDARAAAIDFRRRAGCDSALITRGEQGMWLSCPEAEGAIPAMAREVADVTGAGDTVVATLALALAGGASLVEASVLANHAAGIAVGKFGASTVTREELLAAVGA
jgi:D-beta-D-heptose 7-phosphate kinase/D-beta-D-heptose 1-phosphate adenosyltransferase